MIIFKFILLFLNLQYLNICVVGHSWAVGAFKDWNVSENIVLKAKVGSSIQWSINQIDKIKEGQFDRIYIFTGINDYTNSETKIKNDFDRLIDLVKIKTKKVYLFNIPRYSKCEQKIKNINQYLETKDIEIIDVYTKYKNSNSLHPKSYNGVRELFLETLKKE